MEPANGDLGWLAKNADGAPVQPCQHRQHGASVVRPQFEGGIHIRKGRDDLAHIVGSAPVLGDYVGDTGIFRMFGPRATRGTVKAQVMTCGGKRRLFVICKQIYVAAPGVVLRRLYIGCTVKRGTQFGSGGRHHKIA